ncbi:hypothetical protein [Adhaeribacter aquaticus]|uniref:hypothetical protein n=1 Tax=Adhaeribacter aquaticus TaxID=299567 RepID=UPI00047B8BF1|nr:hypothetical protein [Adhaeribacter aquaticus]
MILYQNSLMVLNYEPSSDILTVEWPNAELFLLPDLKQTFLTLIETVRNYDIKQLLIKTTAESVIPVLDNTKDNSIYIRQVLKGLRGTRLQKIARILAFEIEQDKEEQKLSAEINADATITIQYRTFLENEMAMAWLLE